MKIKEEFLGSKILDPFRGVEIHCWFIPTELYQKYYDNGYDFIFENDEPEIIEPENDITIDNTELDNL